MGMEGDIYTCDDSGRSYRVDSTHRQAASYALSPKRKKSHRI